MAERPYDVAIYGATGFTGGLTAEYLAEHAPDGTRWAVAGRSEHKLGELRARLANRRCPPSGQLLARLDDAESMKTMAAATRVLATTAGPFDEYGEPVVRACVEARTDYLDITGEPHFVARMITRYHDEAKERGLKIVSCCGFDSIPTDLGVLFTIDQVPHDGPLTIEGFVSSRGTFSGGTWHSAVRAFGKFREVQREVRALKEPKPEGRRVGSAKPRLHYEAEIGGWAVPFPTIDPQIVLRSARAMADYGDDFRYAHYVRVRRLPTVIGGVAAVGTVFALAQIAPTRSLLLNVKSPGEGPSEESRARSWFRVVFLARTNGRTVMTEVRGGDPGYGETSKMLGESALCLAHERERTPAHTGVITPAAAMGRPLIERLVRAGIAFEHIRG